MLSPLTTFYLQTIAITSAADQLTASRADQMSRCTSEFLPTLVRCVTLEKRDKKEPGGELKVE
jgi:hypothetical protein